MPTTTAAAATFQDRLRDALDWTIFSAGILSLGIAIGATVLAKTQSIGDQARAETGTERTTF